jgi:hypothetical protein
LADTRELVMCVTREAIVKGFGPVKQQGGNGSGGATSAAAGTLSAGVSELSQLALWMAGTLAGMVTAALTARTPFFRGVMRRLGIADTSHGNGPPAKRPTREQSLPMLAEAILGSSKSAIASVFGPPRSAVVMHAAVALTGGAGGATYWNADTWYYPLPKNGPLAMAIEFQGDDARRVEFLRAPEA